ncbi:MAG: hypothetical protein JWM11_6537 [Planctomycetaceae bacterium]|nr:hypothetical protein [Planctomycetaceae bacterium]
MYRVLNRNRRATGVAASARWLYFVWCVWFSAAPSLPCQGAQIGAAAQAARPAPITEQEASDFADALTEVAQKGDIEGYNALIDWNGILDKATAVPKSPALESARADFRKGGIAELQRSGGMISRINADIKKGGSYKCLRVDVKDMAPYVIFRLKLPTGGGVNYHQLFLDRNPQGKVIASDMFVFLSAERISETFRRGWLPVAKQQLKTSAEKLNTPQEPFLASLDDFKKLTELVSKEKFADALAIYRKLPESVQKDKNTLLIRLRAAQGVSDVEYSEVLDDFRKYYPDDVALDFLLIDSYTIRKKYDLALKCVERTNKNVGGDPMLLVMQANLLVLLKRFPEARKSVESAILEEPDLSEAHAAGLDISLGDQNFDETVKYLTSLEKQFGYKWKDLREVPVFEEFVKSPQYREWVETQK